MQCIASQPSHVPGAGSRQHGVGARQAGLRAEPLVALCVHGAVGGVPTRHGRPGTLQPAVGLCPLGLCPAEGDAPCVGGLRCAAAPKLQPAGAGQSAVGARQTTLSPRCRVDGGILGRRLRGDSVQQQQQQGRRCPLDVGRRALAGILRGRQARREPLRCGQTRAACLSSGAACARVDLRWFRVRPVGAQPHGDGITAATAVSAARR